MSVFQAEEVTDTIKVSKALEMAKQGEIAVIVGKDIDLLVLLTAQSRNVKNAFPLKSGKENAATFHAPILKYIAMDEHQEIRM
ncbi:unnamed protein product [Bemisia tabaci]|uniref:Uncharacterized protein n=1 Tax=Bemisia tabaci TaxID=7038 RepID=A0A9P0A8A8_BEMTA|nr:unnamed protein product [Bemisia tabaci]